MRHLFLLENAQLRFQAPSLALKKCWRKFLLLLSTKEGYYICEEWVYLRSRRKGPAKVTMISGPDITSCMAEARWIVPPLDDEG